MEAVAGAGMGVTVMGSGGRALVPSGAAQTQGSSG